MLNSCTLRNNEPPHWANDAFQNDVKDDVLSGSGSTNGVGKSF